MGLCGEQVGTSLRLGARKGSNEDVKGETSQLFEQEQELLRLRGLRVPHLDMERTWGFMEQTGGQCG